MRWFFNRRRAAAVQQYAIVVGLIAVLALAATARIGQGVTGIMSTANNRIASAGNGTIDGGSSGPTLDTSPDSFGFTNQTNAAQSATVDSNAVTLTGFDGPLTATCGSGCTAIARNGGSFLASPVGGFMPGDTIAIRQTASASLNTTTNASVTVGGTTSANWTVTTISVVCPALGAGCDGSSSVTAGLTCRTLLNAGYTTPGVFWIQPASTAFQVYCEQSFDTGGYAMIMRVPNNTSPTWSGLTQSTGNFTNARLSTANINDIWNNTNSEKRMLVKCAGGGTWGSALASNWYNGGYTSGYRSNCSFSYGQTVEGYDTTSWYQENGSSTCLHGGGNTSHSGHNMGWGGPGGYGTCTGDLQMFVK